MSQDDLQDQGAVAARLNVKVKTLEAWRTRGGGPPFVRVGRLARYQRSDVDAWIESRRVVSTSESVK